MNQQKQVKSSSLFLLELIFSIFFFSAASAVCVQIFVKAHTMSHTSQALNFAVSECSGIAELLTTSESLEDIAQRLSALYPETIQADFPSVSLYYSSDFEVCAQSEANYQLTFTVQDISQSISVGAPVFSTFQALISFESLNNQEQIYSLDVKHHVLQEVE